MFCVHLSTLRGRIRFSPLRVWVALVNTLCVCLFFFPEQGLARETYVQFATRLGSKAPSGTSYRADLEGQLLNGINRYRVSKGKKPLAASNTFRMAARAHAADMALHNFVGHRSSHGEEFSSRMSALLGGGMMMTMPHLAENAARDSKAEGEGGERAQRLVQQWIDSPPHRKAMINGSFKHVSTGVVERGGKAYAVQIFWSDLPSNMKVAGSAPTEDGTATEPADAAQKPKEPAGSLY